MLIINIIVQSVKENYQGATINVNGFTASSASKLGCSEFNRPLCSKELPHKWFINVKSGGSRVQIRDKNHLTLTP